MLNDTDAIDARRESHNEYMRAYRAAGRHLGERRRYNWTPAATNAPTDAVCDHCPLIAPCRVSLGTLTPHGPEPLPCQPASARFAEWKAWRKNQPGTHPGTMAGD